MGHEELIASLRKEGAEKVQALRDEAGAEAEKIRAETDGKIKRLREEFRDKEAGLLKAREEEILSSAERKAKAILLTAEDSLSARLFKLSLACLHELREKGYEDIFSALIKEIPSAPWNEVRVNPSDTGMAREYFRGPVIVPDKDISGGFEAATENGRRQIINTFEKRLASAWEEIMPLLVIDAYKEAGHGVSPGD